MSIFIRWNILVKQRLHVSVFASLMSLGLVLTAIEVQADTMPEILITDEKVALGSYCEMLKEQALESELTPETAPLLFDKAGQLIPERKTQLAHEYMEGLTKVCGVNVLAYSLKPAKKEGAPVLVIEQLQGDPAILYQADRQVIANFKSCVGDIGTEYGVKGTKVSALPEVQRTKMASWLLGQCQQRYKANLAIADSERSIAAADKKIAELRKLRAEIEARISKRTDEIIANFKMENSM